MTKEIIMNEEELKLHIFERVCFYINFKKKRFCGIKKEDLPYEIFVRLSERITRKMMKDEINDNYIFKAIENTLKDMGRSKRREIEILYVNDEMLDVVAEDECEYGDEDNTDPILSLKIKGYKNKEIAKQTGFSESKISKHLMRYSNGGKGGGEIK
jgi:DNA-directed RNA polymerase specialized sigma24 family protein